MPKVEVISRRRMLDDFFKIDEVELRFERYDGTMSEAVRRLNFERGNSARGAAVRCALAHRLSDRAVHVSDAREGRRLARRLSLPA